MRFDDWSYLYPPRPEKAVSPGLVGFYEDRGYISQVKLNGTCSIISIRADEFIAMNRHNEPHRAWTPSTASTAPFKALPGKGWYVFVAELMHNKVVGLRDTNYINDILVADGEYLVGFDFMQRREILENLFKFEDHGDTSHYVIDKNTWLAKNYTSDFSDLYNSLDRPEWEGLVFKNPRAKLAICSRAAANVSWLAKCRKGSKNYSY